MISRVFVTAACAVLVFAVNCNGLKKEGCDGILCEKPLCHKGETPQVVDGKCCPVCLRELDCLGIRCAALNEEYDCHEGEILVVPPGECCPRCVSSCSTETCFKPLCHKGESLEVPEGKCCPVCVRDDCEGECPPGHRCAIDKATNQKVCNPDCGVDNGGCSPDQICRLEPIVCVQAPCPPFAVRCY